MVRCIFVCGLTYGPDGCSDGSQGHEHHTHPDHTTGGQHTGQRDSSTPYRDARTHTHVHILEGLYCKQTVVRTYMHDPKKNQHTVGNIQQIPCKIWKCFFVLSLNLN